MALPPDIVSASGYAPEVSASANPTMASLPPFLPAGPNFSDVMSLLNKPLALNAPPSAGAGGDVLFNRGVGMSTPSMGTDPALQEVLNRIKANTADAASRGSSVAQALAVRRGLPGSSIEQFGVQQALGEAEKAGRDAESQVYLQDAIRRFQLQDLQSKALFDRSNLEYGGQSDVNRALFDAENNRILNAANFTSDEIASQRNIAAMMQQLQLEAMLGQQGIDLGYANIGAQQDINEQNAKYGLINSLTGAVLPGLMMGGGGLFGGGGAAAGAGGGGLFGGMGGLFGGGGGGLFGGGGLTGAATGQFVPGVGMVGTGVPAGMGAGLGMGSLLGGAGLGMLGGMAGNSMFGKGNDAGAFLGGGVGMLLGGPLGAGVGSFLGTAAQRLGGQAYDAAKKSLGNTAGSILKPFINPIGSVTDLIKNPSKKIKGVTKSIKKVFPF